MADATPLVVRFLTWFSVKNRAMTFFSSNKTTGKAFGVF
jgi:hypothetical protein